METFFFSGLFPFLKRFCKIKYQWDIKMIKLLIFMKKYFYLIESCNNSIIEMTHVVCFHLENDGFQWAMADVRNSVKNPCKTTSV